MSSVALAVYRSRGTLKATTRSLNCDNLKRFGTQEPH